MPELPEVETTVNYLKRKVLSRTILDVWTDFAKIIKKPKSFSDFKKQLKGKKIRDIRRRGKNIILELSGGKSLLIHQKLTGHLLIGNWKLEIAAFGEPRFERGNWKPLDGGALNEPVNKYIHLMFWLSEGFMLALSDLRKFAKVELWDSRELASSKDLKSLGPEPLRKEFDFEEFKGALERKRGKIKQVLMDQTVIAGIGNIYSDEILWEAKVHPFKEVNELGADGLMRIYKAMQKILKKAVKLRGASQSDYRLPSGEKGKYQEVRRAYRQEGKPCGRCGTKIKRVKMGGRSAHFCPVCQK